jgi:hypothetical protein
MEFHIWVFFRNLSRKFQVSLKSDQNSWYFTWRPIYFFYHNGLVILRMRNIWDTSCKEKQNTHFMFVTFFFRNWCRLRGNVQKYNRAGQATDDKYGECAFHAGYLRLQTHTVGMGGTYYFSIATFLQERASVWRCTYVTLLVLISSTF